VASPTGHHDSLTPVGRLQGPPSQLRTAHLVLFFFFLSQGCWQRCHFSLATGLSVSVAEAVCSCFKSLSFNPQAFGEEQSDLTLCVLMVTVRDSDSQVGHCFGHHLLSHPSPSLRGMGAEEIHPTTDITWGQGHPGCAILGRGEGKDETYLTSTTCHPCTLVFLGSVASS
jgi:hypothetical protein